MDINRRKFGERLLVMMVAHLLVSCSGSPVQPEKIPAPQKPSAPPATLNYLRTNITASNEDNIKLIQAIRNYSPMGLDVLNPTYNDFFVNGFEGKPYPRLVFFINNERYEDFGVSRKVLSANTRWGCLQI